MGCIRTIFVLVALVVMGVIAWYQRDRLIAIYHDLRGTTVATAEVPSPELARRTQERLRRLTSGDTSTVVLTSAELESLVRFEYGDLLPVYVDSPRVRVDDNKVHLSARIPTDRLVRIEGFGDITQLLPDTTDLEITGQLLPLPGNRIAFAVDAVQAQRLPLPPRLVPGILTALGRKDETGLLPEAIALPLPPGVRNAYVRGDSLILLGSGGGTRQN